MGAELMLEAIGFFLVFLFLGMPVAFAIAISGAIFFILTPDIPWTILVQKSLSTTQSFTMLAIPLFIFAGNLMNNTGITSRLVKLANVLTGHMYGSIGQVSVVLSTLMGGVSGSAVADAAMECRILGPEMTKRGYAPGWAAAVNCLTGLIVATIPPSMGLIIYGTVGEVPSDASSSRASCQASSCAYLCCARPRGRRAASATSRTMRSPIRSV